MTNYLVVGHLSSVEELMTPAAGEQEDVEEVTT